MGNASRSSYVHNISLLSAVDDSLLFLMHLDKSLLLHLLSRFHSSAIQKTFLSAYEFKRLCQNTILEDHQDIILNKFCSSHPTINIYEFFSAIITYSELRWQSKATLLFKLFDFDRSKLLTRDELVIMSKCFFKSIQTMTKNKFHLPFTFENSVITDSFLGNSDGLSLNAYEIFRLVSWLDGQRTLRQLLRQTSKKKSLTHEIPNIFSKTFDKTRVAKENSRRASLNRSHLEKQTKQEKMNSIFFRACNRMKKAQAGNIYNLMIKEPKLLPEADIFFSLFSLKLKTELNFHEFQKVCVHVKEQKRRTREIKSVLGSKKERMSALARKEKEKTAVIQKIFEKYDLNGDGFISFRELRLGIQNFLSKKAAEELFKEYDVDENLLLDQNEFTRLFSGRYVNYP